MTRVSRNVTNMLRKLILPVLLLLVLATGCSVEDQIRFYFGNRGASTSDQERAVRVARCESGLQPTARNGQFTGLFQLGRGYHEGRAARLGYSWDQMWEAGPNIQVAADLWAEAGWGPWSCARSS